MFTVIVSLIVFSIVILVHEVGHFFAAKFFNIQPFEFSIGMGPAIFRLKKKQTCYSLRALPIGGYVSFSDPEASESDTVEQLLQDNDLNNAFWPRQIVIYAAGSLMNFVLGFILIMALVSAQESVVTEKIGYFEDNALCAHTGLKLEDTLYSINHVRTYNLSDFLYELSRDEDGVVDIVVIREGKKVLLENVEFERKLNESGTYTMQLGFKVYAIPISLKNVFFSSIKLFCSYSSLILRSLRDTFLGKVNINEFSGPIGIVSAITTAVRYGWKDVFSLASLITINLGIMNLLPFPVLDGGKIVFVILRKVFHLNLSVKIEMFLSGIGVALLMTMLIVFSMQDIFRLFL